MLARSNSDYTNAEYPASFTCCLSPAPISHFHQARDTDPEGNHLISVSVCVPGGYLRKSEHAPKSMFSKSFAISNGGQQSRELGRPEFQSTVKTTRINARGDQARDTALSCNLTRSPPIKKNLSNAVQVCSAHPQKCPPLELEWTASGGRSCMMSNLFRIVTAGVSLSEGKFSLHTQI